MKRFVLVFGITFAFCTAAMASDIAISTQGGWMSQSHADAESQEIVDNVEGISIEVFTPADGAALADWVAEHTGDGAPDLLVMFGIFPASIYPAGNAQPDGSLAELFLDDGNVIINTGDYIFYVGSAGNNDEPGLENMMDIDHIAMWGDDTFATMFTPTNDGTLYTPSLTTLPSNRPWFPSQLANDWEVELVLAQTSDGTQVHPAIMHNTVTGGRLGVFFQCSLDTDTQLRGEVISEWINNWYLKFVASGNPYARRPVPKNGSLHEDTWISLSWTPGDFAVSHDVYLGENFDDVNDATNESDTFRGNQALPYYVAGFPGFAYPDGLVPGATYYWRVDEVNDADPDSPWKGNVWSFSIPSKTAYNPFPEDRSKFVDGADLILSWTAGFDAKLHTVYFGDDFDTINNASGGIPGALTTYKPGPLELEKTYYWRVDEFDAITTHKGDVWSFKTAKIGGGVKGQYYRGTNFENLVLTRIDPQIDFNWGDPGSPDPVVGDDQFSARWTGEVEAGFTETYTFYGRADDGVRLWIGGLQLVDAWIDQGATEYSGTIDLVEGNKYSVVMEYYENGGGAVAELRWSSPSTPKQFVPQAALSPPIKANTPIPLNGATGASLLPILRWSPGDNAASHEVYFGTDADVVADATKASPEFKATKALGEESYDPGKLAWQTTYYWRVDEVNNLHPDSPWIGDVWSFTTGDFLLVDDFEGYTDNDAAGEAVWQSWIDGFGVAGNGSQVGYLLPPYAEKTIVHSGAQSMPLLYNNSAGVTNSEAERTLTWPRDWTEENVAELSLWFHGDPANAAEPLYVAVSNAVVTNDDPAAAQIDDWTQMVIPLQAFADQGVNLRSVDKIMVGLGSKGGPSAGGSGTMFIDDIRLYRLGEASAP